ncbi:MAG: response regulator [Chloroflexota bacterium]|nr:response regulator [Chloroflexota bacterium]
MAEKILVVDDDIDSLKLIGLMLQRNGYEVIAANQGAQALAKAASDRPDLIILDVMMPDMNGYEVCRRLRKSNDTKGIPIIMFTAKTLIDDKVAGFEAGADDYLTKPTHPAELASRVRAILQRNTSARPVTLTKGTTLGVMGVKGGVGTSTVALNIAASRMMAGDNPIIADFRYGQGSISLALGVARTQGMFNTLSKSVDEIRPRSIEAELVVHQSGLRGLLSSVRAKEAYFSPAPEAETALIRVLRTMSRPAVFDLGGGLTPTVTRLQKEMDQLVVVIDPLPLTLSMAREILNEIDSGRGETAKAQVVVVNRAASSSLPSWQEVEQILGREIRATISLASELVSHALQANTPVVLHQPTAIASSQLIKLAEELSVRARSLPAPEAS